MEHKQRLLKAAASLLASQGYADVSVADMVRKAAVSKRTFYQHFTNKEQCCLTLFQELADSALLLMARAADPRLPLRERFDIAINGYLGHLSRGQGLARALFIDIHHMGPSGRLLRRRVIDRMATFVQETVAGAEAPRVADRHRAVAAVGALHELVLQHIEVGDAADLSVIAPQCVDTVMALVTASDSCSVCGVPRGSSA